MQDAPYQRWKLKDRLHKLETESIALLDEIVSQDKLEAARENHRQQDAIKQAIQQLTPL